MLGSGYGAGGIYYIRKGPHKVGSTNVCVFTEILISHPLIYQEVILNVVINTEI